MNRRTALLSSLLLAGAATAGVFAVLSTAALRSEPPKPEVASERALTRRAKQLDAWQASLARALRARPPSLPALPRYASIADVQVPEAVALPPVTARPTTRVVVRAVRAAAVPVPTTAVAPTASSPPPPTTTTTQAHTGDGDHHSDDGGSGHDD